MRQAQLRIIAGTWRSRRLRVPPGVRPTQDMQRETMFNVLHKFARTDACLDLFAGSGSLGLEALSRGVASATFVERSAKTATVLRHTLADFTPTATVVNQDVFVWLKKPPVTKFNLVFADPPFILSRKKLFWDQLLDQLPVHLAPAARVCLEGPAPIALPRGWHTLRAGKNGAACWSIVARA